MSGTVREAKLQTPTSRAKLKRGRQPHWRAIIPGRVHLGYRRKPGAAVGWWLLRRYADGRYSVETLGRADDGDGHGLSFEAAEELARSRCGTVPGRLTVRRAMMAYVAYLEAQGKSTDDAVGRIGAHILPVLGDIPVAELTSTRIREWLADLAQSQAMLRSGAVGRRNVRQHDPHDAEAVRARRNSANKVLSMLKAGLNHAFDEGLVNDNTAWGRRVRAFNAGAARKRFLSIDESRRLLDACPPDLRSLVRAGLETGCRLSELLRLQCDDFNASSGTVHVRKSKSGRERHVVLTASGITFFAGVAAARPGQMLFARDDGRRWDKSAMRRALTAANRRAGLVSSFHALRHSWASLAAMAGVPLTVIAANLGHASTRVTEKHYAHLAPSFVRDAIRTGAPRFDVAAEPESEKKM
jgi:integrase